MNLSNVDQIVDRIVHASAATYILSGAGVLLLFSFGIAVATWLTPKKDLPAESLRWRRGSPSRKLTDKR